MTTRRIVAAVALAFVAFLAFLTLYGTVKHGVDVFTVASIFVLVLLGVGIVGALASGPDE